MQVMNKWGEQLKKWIMMPKKWHKTGNYAKKKAEFINRFDTQLKHKDKTKK